MRVEILLVESVLWCAVGSVTIVHWGGLDPRQNFRLPSHRCFPHRNLGKKTRLSYQEMSALLEDEEANLPLLANEGKKEEAEEDEDVDSSIRRVSHAFARMRLLEATSFRFLK